MINRKTNLEDQSGVSDVRHLATPVEQARDDRLFHEINLLKIEGRYFSFAPIQRGKNAKPAGDRVQPLPDLKEVKRQLQAGGKTDESVFIVTPHPDRGQPGELAYKVLQVILKRVSELRFTALDSVQFSFRELAHLCGRTAFGGKDVKELARAVDQLLTTVVTVGFYNKPTKKWGVHQFTVVNSVAYRGDDKSSHGDPDGAVMLHPLFIRSLQDGHFLCLNFSRFGALTEAITQALYKRLYFIFSIINSKQGRPGFPFKKAYEDICTDWLSGLVVQKHRSEIIRQLGNHLDQLKRMGLLSLYDIVRKKDGTGFNLECSPGNAFFEDYTRFYSADLPAIQDVTLRLLPNATASKPEAELAAYFYHKKYGTQARSSDLIVSTADLGFARVLLAKHPLAECQSFIDFALTEARSTNFDVRNFRGLLQYHGAFITKREERLRQQAAEARRREKEQLAQLEQALADGYDCFKRDQVEQIRASLPSSTLSALEQIARRELEQGPLRFPRGSDRLVKLAVDDQLARERGIASFEEWKAAREQGLN